MSGATLSEFLAYWQAEGESDVRGGDQYRHCLASE